MLYKFLVVKKSGKYARIGDIKKEPEASLPTPF